MRLFATKTKQKVQEKQQQQQKEKQPELDVSKSNKKIENGFVAVDIEHNIVKEDDKNGANEQKMVEYVDVSEDVRIPICVSNNVHEPATGRSISSVGIEDNDEISSNSTLAEVAANLPDITSPHPIKMGDAWASRENTMTDSKTSTPENTAEFPTQMLRSKTSESLRLESMSPIDQVGWSPRPRLGTTGSLAAVAEEKQGSIKKPQTAPDQSNRPGPVTAKSSGALTQGARKAQTQTPRTGAGWGVAGSRPKTPGASGAMTQRTTGNTSQSRPKTPGPASSSRPKTRGPASSSRPKTPGPARPKTPGPPRPKTPATGRPKTPGSTSTTRLKTPKVSGHSTSS